MTSTNQNSSRISPNLPQRPTYRLFEPKAHITNVYKVWPTVDTNSTHNRGGGSPPQPPTYQCFVHISDLAMHGTLQKPHVPNKRQCQLAVCRLFTYNHPDAGFRSLWTSPISPNPRGMSVTQIHKFQVQCDVPEGTSAFDTNVLGLGQCCGSLSKTLASADQQLSHPRPVPAHVAH